MRSIVRCARKKERMGYPIISSRGSCRFMERHLGSLVLREIGKLANLAGQPSSSYHILRTTAYSSAWMLPSVVMMFTFPGQSSVNDCISSLFVCCKSFFPSLWCILSNILNSLHEMESRICKRNIILDISIIYVSHVSVRNCCSLWLDAWENMSC